MKVTRTSPFSGKTNTMDIDVTEEQFRQWHDGTPIQRAMPNLLPIMYVITPEEWPAFGIRKLL